MSLDTSRTTARLPRRASTGNAATRPDKRTALHLRLRASPKHSVSTAHSNPITTIQRQN